MGEVAVEKDKLWGPQTQRSLENFKIGNQKMPFEIIYAITLIKKAAAHVNAVHGKISARQAGLIKAACDEILSGKLDSHFPLSVWQTGSGTQTNMNVNEVIANRGNAIAGEKLLHPNDHVNCSQSSNDVFPSALHIAVRMNITNSLILSLQKAEKSLLEKEKSYEKTVKVGRTHLQDAVPMTFGQEISGWREAIFRAKENIVKACEALSEIALGGTAVGTGLNAFPEFGPETAAIISDFCGQKFHAAENKFYQLSFKDGLSFVNGALKTLAAALLKIANDVRLLASGPRCGIGEIKIPPLEPGSSIMPSKVNPTQCEALAQVAIYVMGNDAAVGMAASQGHFQLNTYMPLIGYLTLSSVICLADAVDSFTTKCLSGLEANAARMENSVRGSLMCVTALTPHIGYDMSAKIAKLAAAEDLTLRDAALKSGLVSAEQFDTWVDPLKMI
jgi:fumarate hydratase class II